MAGKAGVLRRVLLAACVLAVAALAASAALVMLFEEKFIYFPTKGGVGPSPGEEVFLDTEDGVRIHGWYVEHPDARVALLWLHGNAGNLEHRRPMVEAYRGMPADVLVIDYRGYGRSGGRPSEAGLVRDARAAWEWLRARAAPKPVVVLGKSLGAGPACELARRVELDGLILQSAFTSVPDMAPRVMPLLPIKPFVRTRFDNLAKVGEIRCPKLFVHGRDDEIVPFEMGERLYAAAAEPKEHAWFDGAGHNDLAAARPRRYLERLGRFCARVARR